MSGRDLGFGNKSRNQSRTDVAETLPEDRGPLIPQRQQGQREPPQESKKHAGGLNLLMKGAFRGCIRTQHDAALATLSVNNPFT